MVSTRRIVGKVKSKLVPKHSLNAQETRQFIEWSRALKKYQEEMQHFPTSYWVKKPKTPDFLRQEKPEERLARTATRRVRFGPMIRLQQVATVPETPAEERLLEQTLQEIRDRWGKKFSYREMENLLAKARVLQTNSLLRKELGGRDPIVFQILALTALRFGLDSAELGKQARTLGTIYQKHPRLITWKGNPSGVRKAILFKLPNGNLLLTEIERKLFESKSAINSRLLAQRVGLDWNEKHFMLLNTGLQFLEVAGFAKKYPITSTKGIHTGVWVHAAHSNPPLDYPNTDTYLLGELFKGPREASELYRPHKWGASYSGNPKSSIPAKHVRFKLNEFEKKGLVVKERVLAEKQYGAGTTRKGKQRTIVIKVRLTPFGRQLANEIFGDYEKTGQLGPLPEWGRKLLLGEKRAK